ncbi:MAG TPA: hypothetical protein VEJ88_08870 [Dissulfurispiraceae bacterium]|nr:hypothetical protein [Dissulfurispiraceae bacterium]
MPVLEPVLVQGLHPVSAQEPELVPELVLEPVPVLALQPSYSRLQR